MAQNDIDYRYGLLPYHLASFFGGESDYEDKGIVGSYKNSQALDPRKRKDSLSAQQALTDDLAPGTMTNLSMFQVVADDGNIYHLCRDGKIFSRHSDGSYHLVYTDTNESGNIIGAGQWYDNAGWTYLLWATPTRLNIKKLLGPGYTPAEPWVDVNVASTGTWPKTNLTSTTFHTMKICNGTLQICNANWLAFVGFDLSFTNQALQLIPGNKAQALVERGVYTIVGSNKSVGIDESSLYAWDGISANYNNKQIFKVKQINAMIDTEYALMQVGSAGQLYISDMNNPMPLTSFYGGGQVNPDAVASYLGMAMFGVQGNSSIEGAQNGIWSFGRLKKNATPILNFEYPLVCDEIGSVTVSGGDIFVTYRSGSNYGVKHIDQSNKATAIYQTLDLVAPMGSRRFPMPLDRMLVWDHARLLCAPLPAGCKVELWYRIDKVTSSLLNANANSAGWVQANTQDGAAVVQETTTNRMDIVFRIGEKARVMEFMIKLIPSGNNTPEVHEANFYYMVG